MMLITELEVEKLYLALVSMDLLSAKNLPSESLQLLRTVLSRLSVGTYNTRTELLCQDTNIQETWNYEAQMPVC